MSGTITLAQIENSVLDTLQQTELVNWGGSPNWTAATNPDFGQANVDFRINEGYLRAMRDVSAIDVAIWTATFSSVASTFQYPIVPAVASGNPNPPCAQLRRLYYAPVGFPFTLEFEPGIRMVPWKEFQRYTAAGYLQTASFGPYPEVCAVTPDRKFIQFFPGTANNGDTITLQYSPVPTAGTLVPLLVNETDTMLLPDDFGALIEHFALFKLWPKARAMNAATASFATYKEQMGQAIAEWKQRSAPDKLRITDALLDRATSGPWGWW